MEGHSDDSVMTRQCPVCDLTVPAAVFCEDCGAELAVKPSYWRILLRPRVYAADPRQPIALPLVSSTLFPRLPKPYRRPFQHALILIAIALAVFSMLRLLAPLVVITTLGVLLLFVLYLWQSNAVRDVPARALAITSVVGAAIGVGWWLRAGQVVANAYDVSIAASAQLQNALDIGFVLNGGGALVMGLPAVLVRLMRIPVRESLNGFVVGALGALCCSSASTITWLAPQFIAGLIDNYGSARLFDEAILYGVADPLTAAAFGGLVGIALWFRPCSPRRPRGQRTTLAVFAGLALLFYLLEYEIDAVKLPRAAEELMILALTALALVVLRAGIQIALLHEDLEPVVDGRVACGFCGQVVPAMAFCSDCGGAILASGLALLADRVGSRERAE